MFLYAYRLINLKEVNMFTATIVRRRRHNVTLHVPGISRIFIYKFFLIMHLLTCNLEPK